MILTPEFAELKANRVTRTIKQLGKDGKLKKVMKAILDEMDSESDDPDEINSDDEFWKTEPINGYTIRPTFIPLLPLSTNK